MGCVWIVRLCYCGFELAGATLSPTRISRCPDQSGNLYSLAHEQGVLLTRPRKVCKNGNLLGVCVLKLFYFFLFFYWARNKVGCFLYHGRVCISFDLHSMCSVNVLVGLVTRNSYTEPVSTPNTSTTLVCWNGLRLLFNVLLLLDPHQLYWVSTVPVEPWGVALETSVSYQHYWCSVSVDL